MIQNRERMYLNVIKGIAIVLMIWGHCIQYCAMYCFDYFENGVHQFIYSFHMPLFMLVSGYLFFFSFEKRDLKTLLIHRTQGMLQPIVFGSVLNLLLMELPTALLYGYLNIFNGKLLNSLYSLWFLWCVLSSSLAVALAEKLGRNVLVRFLYLAAGVAIVALFPEYNYHLYMYPYFVAGFLYGKYRSRIPGWLTKMAYLSLAAFPVLLLFFERRHYIYVTPIYTTDLARADLNMLNCYRWAIGFAGSLFVLTVTDLLFRWTEGRKLPQRIFGMLAKLGENSLAIYVISVSLLSYYLPKAYDRFLMVLGSNLPAEHIGLYNFVFTPVLTVLYCFGLYYVVLLMKKIKIHRIVFGR